MVIDAFGDTQRAIIEAVGDRDLRYTCGYVIETRQVDKFVV